MRNRLIKMNQKKGNLLNARNHAKDSVNWKAIFSNHLIVKWNVRIDDPPSNRVSITEKRKLRILYRFLFLCIFSSPFVDQSISLFFFFYRKCFRNFVKWLFVTTLGKRNGLRKRIASVWTQVLDVGATKSAIDEQVFRNYNESSNKNKKKIYFQYSTYLMDLM